jgi:hypothetical protein
MKYLLGVCLLLSLGVATRADSQDQVALTSSTYNFTLADKAAGAESFAVTFNWDVTTESLTNFALTANGPITGFLNDPAFSTVTSSGIYLLDFDDSKGDVFQMDFGIHDQFFIGTAPGTYQVDTDLICPSCLGSTDIFGDGFAIVTDPPAVPEPSSVLLLMAGVGLLALLNRKPGILFPNRGF